MVPRWQIFDDFSRPAFAASRVQHVSDLHLKYSHYKATPCVEVWQTSNLRRLRLGEEKRKKKKEETTGRKYKRLPYSIGRPLKNCSLYTLLTATDQKAQKS